MEELQRLRESRPLTELLAHYAEGGAADREIWQDRLMALAGVEPRELSRLHGELIAFGWIEQNTGGTPGLRAGALPGCYRITSLGQRALKRAQNARDLDEDELLAA